MNSYPPQINSLTSIRFFAAAWVVLFHYRSLVNSAVIAEFPIVRAGYLGVDFFFVLSGFVLCHVYNKKLRSGDFDYWDFLTKRIGRIYPMHIFTLLLFIMFGLISQRCRLNLSLWDPADTFSILDRGQLVRMVTSHVTLIHAWGSTNGLFFNLPSWSISAEWFAYMSFPVFMILATRPRLRAPWVMLFCSGAFMVLSAVTWVTMRRELTAMTWNVGIFRIVPEFVLGISLYGFGEQWSAGRWAPVAALGSGMVVVVTVLAADLLPDLHWLFATTTVLSLAGIILFASDSERHFGQNVLCHRFLVLLGEISYSVYMLHLAVGVALFEVFARKISFDAPLSGAAAILGGLGAVTALSYVTYRLIELPGRRMITAAARRLNHPARAA
jgi:peptidoglycan/LPS O-acetylase OafA/YrhL